MQVTGSIPQPDATQEGSPGRKCPGGELWYLHVPRKGTVGSIYGSCLESTTACEDAPARPSGVRVVLDRTLFPGPSQRDRDIPPGERHARAAGSHVKRPFGRGIARQLFGASAPCSNPLAEEASCLIRPLALVPLAIWNALAPVGGWGECPRSSTGAAAGAHGRVVTTTVFFRVLCSR